MFINKINAILRTVDSTKVELLSSHEWSSMIPNRDWILNDEISSIVHGIDYKVEENDQFEEIDLVFAEEDENLENLSALV